MTIKKYYGINIDYINPSYFNPQKDCMGFEVGSNPFWERKSNGKEVKIAALHRIEGDPKEFYQKNYPNLLTKFMIGNLNEILDKAIVEIDQPK
jgi:hypothetical protein